MTDEEPPACPRCGGEGGLLGLLGRLIHWCCRDCGTQFSTLPEDRS
jgi:tRNA(Ile2) C34 agmatinyltransferase TiaS